MEVVVTDHMTDKDLQEMVAIFGASTPVGRKAAKELTRRTISLLRKRLPSPTGVCANGHHVVLDNKGPMSTGYWCHQEGGVCNHVHPRTGAYSDGYEVMVDPDTPRRKEIKAIIVELERGMHR